MGNGGANVAGGTWGMDHTSALCKAAWRCVACGAFYSSPPLTGTSMTTVVSTAESTVDISTPTSHMNFVLSFSWVVHASGRLPHTRARRGPLDLSRQGGGGTHASENTWVWHGCKHDDEEGLFE